MEKIKNRELLKNSGFINGVWQDADSKQRMTVANPATGDILADVPKMATAETRRAIEAAAAAFSLWRSQSGKQRSAVLQAWYRLLLEEQEDLARIMTLEQGKPLAEARGETLYGASFLEWFAEEAKRGGGEIVPAFKANTQVRVTKEAAGVAAMVTPWNFPIAMITRKAGPALAAGCTAVIKPAGATPLSAIAVVALAEKAGVPAGVINLVMGDSAAIGLELCSHPAVKVFSFTGSTEIGKQLAAQCATTVKKTALELGGNAPFIVFDDADLALAAKQALASKFRNAGQTCVCANRFYVQSGVHDEFVELFKKEIETLKVGNGLEEGVTQGPLINAAAVEKVKQHVADALQKGGKLIVGGSSLAGNYFEPTLITEMNDDTLPLCEETFGPLAPVYRFQTEEEVINMANNTPYGLAAYFCSRDLGRVMRVSEALEAGLVGVNEGIISSEVAPFGGIKESGIGREGGYYGMDEYTEIKYTLMGYAGS